MITKYLKLSILGLFLSITLTGCFTHYDNYNYDQQYIYNFGGTWKGSLKEQSATPQTAQIDLKILDHDYSKDVYSYFLAGTWTATFSPTLTTYGIFEGSANAYDKEFYGSLNLSDVTSCYVTVRGSRLENKISGIYYPTEARKDGCSTVNLKAGTFEITKE